MMVSPQCYRVVINRDHVGEDCGLDYEGPTDIFEGGECDEAFLRIATEAGWLPDLLQYREAMCPRSQQLLDDAVKAVKAASSSSVDDADSVIDANKKKNLKREK
eukprot:c10154_g1_i1.p1 GENE.c10154_g1_i1~~c10154_g1_i1.p1  ORF type:complete len:104 (+),score=24.28 c10154_g1_i1:148-459(+)